MGAIFSTLKTGIKRVAAGKVQSSLGAQSPQLASAAVRIGRFFYTVSLGWITLTWYTTYVNERTSEGEGPRFITPGSLPVISAPDRKDKSLPDLLGGSGGIAEGVIKGGEEIVKGVLSGAAYQGKGTAGRKLIAISPSQLGVPGSALAGYLWSAPSKETPPYEAKRYKELLNIAMKMGTAFGLKLTSGYRPGSTGAGGKGDLHGVGLAFDLVGSEQNMKRAASWSAKYPGMFQEIFVHNEGSGLHLHIGFYPDAGRIFSEQERYARANNSQAAAPTASALT